MQPEETPFSPKSAWDGSPRVTIIDTTLMSSLPRIRDLWAYRDLLAILTWRDVAVRYKQTIFGIAWALLQPLLMMVIFSLLFGRLARLPSDSLPYPVFALAGLVVWGFFSAAVTNGGNSLVSNASLITKVHFPRLIIPCATVAAALVDFAVGITLLLSLSVYYGVPLTGRLLLLPVVVLLLSTLAVAVALWMAALNVKYRDVRYALPFMLQLWMFASPVIYPLSLVPPNWRWLITLNPLTGIIETMRASIGARSLDVTALASTAAMTSLALLYALHLFQRMERDFADLV
jgi:lipopolysaccharide transport system permease protein